MKIEDLLDSMSKSYLERIVKSFTSELYKKDEEGYREQIRSNSDHLGKESTILESIRAYLEESRHPYQDGLLITFILRTLLGSSDYCSIEEDIIESVRELESEIIEKSKSKESFKHIEERDQDIFRVLLEAALEDNSISEDELNLIIKVRRKLGLHENDHFMIQARLNHFPQKDNEVHKLEQIKLALVDLQKCGVVFYCNKMENQPFIIPDELVDGVKGYLGIELIDEKFDDLLDILTLTELRVILSEMNLKQSGKKEELIERIMITGVKPSEVLDSLSNTRLSELCKTLPEVKSSGPKDEKIQRIIKHFDDLIGLETEESESEGEKYYKFFEQLAKKDMANLLGKKVIKHERDAELAFERATHYLFEFKLSHEPIRQNGNEHCDGCLNFGNGGELMMWDNKALMMEKYKFPNNHLRQFKRYIRDASVRGNRVNCFLVIVPEFEDVAKSNAYKLKVESGTDTDVAVISASNLKWVAEEWASKNGGKPFNLEVFNMTGLLTKDELKTRVRMLG